MQAHIYTCVLFSTWFNCIKTKTPSEIAFLTRPQKTDHLQSVCTCLIFLISGGETAEEVEEEEEVEEKTEEAEKEEAAEPAKGKPHASLCGTHTVTVLLL